MIKSEVYQIYLNEARLEPDTLNRDESRCETAWHSNETPHDGTHDHPM